MELNPLTIWAPVLFLTILMRRDRRGRTRLPILGLIGLALALAAYIGWRLAYAPGPLTYEDGAYLHVALAAAAATVLLAVVAWTRALLGQDRRRLVAWWRRERTWLLTCLALALAAAAAYTAYGTRLASRGVFETYDRLFWSDPDRYVRILDGQALEHEHVTHKHPLFPLYGHGLARIVGLVCGRYWAPLAISSLAGGLCVGLAALYFRSITRSRLLGFLAALVLGCTAGHIVFSALPESYALCAATLVLLHLLVAGRGTLPLRFRHHVLTAVLASGVTLTNAFAALVCFVASWPRARRGRMVLRWFACTTLISGGLLALQSHALPTSAPGRAWKIYASDTNYVARSVSPGQAVQNVLRGMLLDNVVAPSPTIVYNVDYPIIYTGTHDTWLTRLAAGVWIALALSAIGTLAAVRAARHATLWAAAICLLFAAGLHSFYGNQEVFLYSCTFTFFLLAVLSHALPHVPRPLATAALVLLAVVLVANNTVFCTRILAVLDRLAGPGAAP